MVRYNVPFYALILLVMTCTIFVRRVQNAHRTNIFQVTYQLQFCAQFVLNLDNFLA
jgi:uncharacterized membrane protein YhaH (DUF805 family)